MLGSAAMWASMPGLSEDSQKDLEREGQINANAERLDEVAFPPCGAWDFPMSRGEKIRRLLMVFETEVEYGSREVAALRQENEVLRRESALAKSRDLSPYAAAAMSGVGVDARTVLSQEGVSASCSESPGQRVQTPPGQLSSPPPNRAPKLRSSLMSSSPEERQRRRTATLNFQLPSEDWQEDRAGHRYASSSTPEIEAFLTDVILIPEEVSNIAEELGEKAQAQAQVLKQTVEAGARELSETFDQTAQELQSKAQEILGEDLTGKVQELHDQAQELHGKAQEQAQALANNLTSWATDLHKAATCALGDVAAASGQGRRGGLRDQWGLLPAAGLFAGAAEFKPPRRSFAAEHQAEHQAEALQVVEDPCPPTSSDEHPSPPTCPCPAATLSPCAAEVPLAEVPATRSESPPPTPPFSPRLPCMFPNQELAAVVEGGRRRRRTTIFLMQPEEHDPEEPQSPFKMRAKRRTAPPAASALAAAEAAAQASLASAAAKAHSRDELAMTPVSTPPGSP
mmetsp:Transcript_139658/g.246871  ORF Transcript_139658/g.246871 Transcript_139658/m.246871 type:complete len:512 (+) Transcript_139658:96-1631(+)